MKAHMKLALCKHLNLDPKKPLTANVVWDGNVINFIKVMDGKTTYHLYSGTPEFNIAKPLFGINERIKTPNFTYKIEG